jgi:predicted nuclease with TOPRIM domain
VKNKILIIVILCSLFNSAQLEARKGKFSLFKVGAGARALKGIKNYNINTLTVEQLKACLIQEKNIDSSEQELNIKANPLDEKKAVLNRLEKEITYLENYLDLNQHRSFITQTQVDEFNLKVESYNALVEKYNIEISAYKALEIQYNKLVGSHNDLISMFDLNCAGKRYYEDDLVAAKLMLSEIN